LRWMISFDLQQTKWPVIKTA